MTADTHPAATTEPESWPGQQSWAQGLRESRQLLNRRIREQGLTIADLGEPDWLPTFAAPIPDGPRTALLAHYQANQAMRELLATQAKKTRLISGIAAARQDSDLWERTIERMTPADRAVIALVDLRAADVKALARAWHSYQHESARIRREDGLRPEVGFIDLITRLRLDKLYNQALAELPRPHWRILTGDDLSQLPERQLRDAAHSLVRKIRELHQRQTGG